MTQEFKPMSAEVLKERGRCCKSACLHCPYGHTLKTQGLELKNVQEKDIPELNALLSEYGKQKPLSFIDKLLHENLGEKKENLEISSENIQKCKLIFLKDHYCGFLYDFNELYLEKDFRFQGITLEVVKEYI